MGASAAAFPCIPLPGPVLGRLAHFSYFPLALGCIASPYPTKYHYRFMLPARSYLSSRGISLPMLFALLLCAAIFSFAPSPVHAQQSTEIIPLSQVRPGMQGYAYTI